LTFTALLLAFLLFSAAKFLQELLHGGMPDPHAALAPRLDQASVTSYYPDPTTEEI